MSVSCLDNITKIGVEDMGDLADSLHDPEVLRLENLDKNLRPPASALACDDDHLRERRNEASLHSCEKTVGARK